MGRAWTEQDDWVLRGWWGVVGADSVAKKVGRTQRAVVARAQKLGLGPARGGSMTLAAFAKWSGYSRSRIRTAAKRLGLRLQRVPRSDPRYGQVKHRWHAFSAEDIERIVEYLGTLQDGRRLHKAEAGAWGGPARGGGSKPEACVDCGRNDVPYCCHGRCKSCDRKWRSR